jgi:hypothetical protein
MQNGKQSIKELVMLVDKNAAESVFQQFKHVRPRLNRAAVELLCSAYEAAKAPVMPGEGQSVDRSTGEPTPAPGTPTNQPVGLSDDGWIWVRVLRSELTEEEIAYWNQTTRLPERESVEVPIEEIDAVINRVHYMHNLPLNIRSNFERAGFKIVRTK